MKPFFLGFLVATLLFTALFVYLHRVGSSPRHQATAPNDLYRDWEAKTRDLASAPGADAEEVWIGRVRDAFTPFEPDRAAENFPRAYAEDLYFRDAFHLYTDRDSLTDYMVKSAKMSPGVTFTFSDPVWSGIDAWLPWVMVLPAKDGGEPQRSLGVSHLRFNAEGKVIFHQDYWDSADVLVPKVPVANGLIELVRRRF